MMTWAGTDEAFPLTDAYDFSMDTGSDVNAGEFCQPAL